MVVMFLINSRDDDYNDVNYSWYKQEAAIKSPIHVLSLPKKIYVNNVDYIPQSYKFFFV